MSRYIWLIDNGHGGLINGQPQTAGRRAQHSDGRWIYEGDFNRKIAAALTYFLTRDNIQVFNLVPQLEDVSLQTRVRRAHIFHKNYKNCIYLSIHGNAGRGNGFEVFTSVGETQSDKIATIFVSHYETSIPEFPVRKDFSDGDPDKEAQFYVLRKTRMPAILTENLFLDRASNREFMLSAEGQERIARAHHLAICDIEKFGLD